MHYLRDYHARISLPIFTDFYLVKIQARISLPKRMNLRSAQSAKSSALDLAEYCLDRLLI